MSLLLDALKKAAQQKAQKSKSELLADRASDETLLEPHAAGSTAGSGDETEFENSEINARLERGSAVRGAGDDTGLEFPDATDMRVRQDRSTSDDTGLDYTDSATARDSLDNSLDVGGDDTGLEVSPGDDASRINLSEQLETGEDQSIVIESGDATDFAVEFAHTPGDTGEVEDETGLEQAGESGELTGIGAGSVSASPGDADETDLSQIDGEGNLTGIGTAPLDGLEPAGEETDLSRSGLLAEHGDETDLGQPPGSDADPTDFSQPPSVAELMQAADDSQDGAREPSDDAQAGAGGVTPRGMFDEDLSLLLLEPDPTNPRLAESNAFGDQPGGDVAAGDFNARAAELELLDDTVTRPRVDADDDTQGPTLTNQSETAVYGEETHTLPAPVARRPNLPGDETSTRTYAPDNYDRTLMKLPSDDASSLFAGMKSDTEVVMTPDYAKKVFRSKTSARRVRHYKLYGGIAAVIVLSIGIFGITQYQQESFDIDSSLRPLKRDPMPGVIKTAEPEETNLFAANESNSTARTIEIIETAEVAATEEVPDSADAAETTAAAGTAESSGADEAGASTDTAATTESSETVASESGATGVVALTPPLASGSTETVDAAGSTSASGTETSAAPAEVAEADSVEPAPTAVAAAQPVTPQASEQAPETEQVAELTSPTTGQAPQTQAAESSNLQIETSSQFRQSDIWLREAYAAYSRGNDKQALRLYNQVLEVDPENRNALLARAAISIQNRDIDTAIRDYRKLLLANPKDSQAMASLLAVTSYSPLETESQLKLMIYEEPDSPFLNFALANAYGAQNRWQEAQQYYFRALQTNPEDPNYAYNLAVSLEHIAQPSSAVNYYQLALANFDKGLATFDREVVVQRLQRLENL